jgi:UDP-N-acetylenolpyruvoylglucosamine reductase
MNCGCYLVLSSQSIGFVSCYVSQMGKVVRPSRNTFWHMWHNITLIRLLSTHDETTVSQLVWWMTFLTVTGLITVSLVLFPSPSLTGALVKMNCGCYLVLSSQSIRIMSFYVSQMGKVVRPSRNTFWHMWHGITLIRLLSTRDVQLGY